MTDPEVDDEAGERAGALIIEIVENQLEDNDPPETKETLERLVSEGESRDNAIRHIACALTIEIFGALKHQQTFDLQRYTRNLKALPKEPIE